MSSHFSFTNSLYDKCNIDKKQFESTAPYNWVTDQLSEHKSKCNVNSTPFMHNNFKNIPASSIDIENDLMNRNRLLSRCPETRFDPTKLNNCKACNKCNEGLPCGCIHCKEAKYQNKLIDSTKCDKGLIPEYTRINKPCNIFSGISINRFNILCEDLQDTAKIQSNSYIGSNTRLQVKDAFKIQKNVSNVSNSSNGSQSQVHLKDHTFYNSQSSFLN